MERLGNLLLNLEALQKEAGLSNGVVFQTKTGVPFIVSYEDSLFVSTQKWHLVDGYPTNSYRKQLHRLLMNPQKGYVVDHINRNPLDNRRENLRVVSHQVNARNRKRSETHCVIRDNNWKKWVVKVTFNYTQIKLGAFDDIETAKATAKAANQRLDEFIRTKPDLTTKEVVHFFTGKELNMSIDLDALSRKILDERAGILPPGSVTVEELRQALEQQRQRFAANRTNEPRGSGKSTGSKRASAPSSEVLAAIGSMKLPGAAADKPLFPPES